MNNTSYFTEGAIVKRKKLGVIDHTGIIVHECGMQMVVHNTPGKGVVMEPLEKFSTNVKVEIAKKYAPTLYSEIIVNNARNAIGTNWTPLYNCQHFVTEMSGLKKESYQLQATLFLFALGLLLHKIK